MKIDYDYRPKGAFFQMGSKTVHRTAAGKISAQPHTFIMHTVLCLLKTMNRTIECLWD